MSSQGWRNWAPSPRKAIVSGFWGESWKADNPNVELPESSSERTEATQTARPKAQCQHLPAILVQTPVVSHETTEHIDEILALQLESRPSVYIIETRKQQTQMNEEQYRWKRKLDLRKIVIQLQAHMKTHTNLLQEARYIDKNLEHGTAWKGNANLICSIPWDDVQKLEDQVVRDMLEQAKIMNLQIAREIMDMEELIALDEFQYEKQFSKMIAMSIADNGHDI